MKNVKIVNLSKVEAMIEAAEKRVSMRKLSLSDIQDALDRVSDRLFEVSTKKDAIGTTVEVDVNYQHFPNCYKGIPESTHFTAAYRKDGWKVEAVFRARCWTSSLAVIKYTEATKDAMALRMSVIG